MKTILFSAVIILFMTSVQFCIKADWVDIGPGGAVIQSMTINGNNIFAGTYHGKIFRSTNLGVSWEKVLAVNQSHTITGIKYNAGYIYAATWGGGIYVSSNNGNTWVMSNSGLTGYGLSAWTFDFTGSTVLGGTHAGIYKSTNNGANWVLSINGLTNVEVRSIAVSSGKIFVGTQGGLFASTDNGNTWFASGNGLTNTNVRSLLVNGTDVFAGTMGGLFKSTNMGESWSYLNCNSFIFKIFAFGSELYAGTWTSGIFRSTDNGNTWTNINNGLTENYVIDFVSSGSTIYTGIWGGVFSSTNNGNNWVGVNNGLNGAALYSLVIHNNALFVGTWGNGIERSTDDGLTWTYVNSGLTNRTVYGLGSDGSNIYAATSAGVCKSTNNGNDWITINNGLTNLNAWGFGFLGSNVFVSTTGGVFKSTNAGISWTMSSNGITNPNTRKFLTDGNNIFVTSYGNNGGIFLSTDSGSNWIPKNNGITSYTGKAVTINNGVLYYAADLGPFRSTDYGNSWTHITSGLGPTYHWHNVVALYTIGNLTLCGTGQVSTNGGGAYKITNQQTTWQPVGLTGISVTNLSSNSQFIYASTLGAGLNRIPVPEIVGAVNISNNVPNKFLLKQNYPNPFNPSTTIEFEIPSKELVKIEVFDVTGKIISQLVNESLESGSYKITFNAEKNGSGIYYYRIIAGNYNETKKMILMK